MKRIFAIGCVPLALMAPLPFPATATAAPSIHQTITCRFLKAGSLTFEVPAKRGDLPQIDFDYPTKATLFSFRDGNLSLAAMDEGEPARLRIVISAQLNKRTGSYNGHILVDMGGNQLMMHNGSVRCTVTAAPP